MNYKISIEANPVLAAAYKNYQIYNLRDAIKGCREYLVEAKEQVDTEESKDLTNASHTMVCAQILLIKSLLRFTNYVAVLYDELPALKTMINACNPEQQEYLAYFMMSAQKKMGFLIEARVTFEEFLLRQIQNPRIQAKVLLKLAKVYLTLNNHLEAKPLLQEAKPLCTGQKLQIRYRHARVQYNIKLVNLPKILNSSY